MLTLAHARWSLVMSFALVACGGTVSTSGVASDDANTDAGAQDDHPSGADSVTTIETSVSPDVTTIDVDASKTDGGCGPGEAQCVSGCVNLKSDPENCGACAQACAPGLVCQSGKCECSPGKVLCKGACTNVESDPANCGVCGLMCSAEDVCSKGKCQCECPSGMTTCGGECNCKDLKSDPQNCGSCGSSCPSGCPCVSGTCDCGCGGPGKTLCAGYCTDLSTDPSNCGACGLLCQPGQMCMNGLCVCGCPAGMMSCGTPCTCANVAIDPNNCGQCGLVCVAGTVCVNGMCS